MNSIHDNEVNNIAECNLLPDIINTPKLTKNLNIHYYTILHGCMNTIKGKSEFKNFRILLDCGCSYTIVTGKIVKNYILKNDVMQWHMQAEKLLLILRLEWILPYLQ